MYGKDEQQFLHQLQEIIRAEITLALNKQQQISVPELSAPISDSIINAHNPKLGILEPSHHKLPEVKGDSDDKEVFTNPWVRARKYLREPFAECIGTFMLVFFGTAVNCQVNVSSALLGADVAKGNWLSDCFAWGIGIGLGAWISGGISGGHINPAVTLAMATFRKFPWRKVPVFWAAQISGGILAALVSYSIYCNPIRMVDPEQTQKTASNFATFPAGSWLETPSTRISTWWNECFGTIILIMTVLASGDKLNNAPPSGMGPLVLLFMLAGLAMAIGWQTSFVFNPARDLGPRIALWIVGYPKHVLWTRNAWYWIWTPILGPFSGALFGAFIYDMFIYTGPESWINSAWSRQGKVDSDRALTSTMIDVETQPGIRDNAYEGHYSGHAETTAARESVAVPNLPRTP